MLSEDEQERGEALSAARAIRPSATGPALRAALIALLERQNQTEKHARESGMPLENPESLASLQHVVAELRDPNAISALAGALGMFTAIRALARFGEQAIPAVIGAVSSPESHYSAVTDGLLVLRWIIEQRRDTLSERSISEIRRAAEQRLTGQQNFSTLWYAMDLAAALGDEELRSIVADLATYPQAIIARGVIDPDIVQRTQQHARDRLAGVPALPRPEP
jgi:hypothetical protein